MAATVPELVRMFMGLAAAALPLHRLATDMRVPRLMPPNMAAAEGPELVLTVMLQLMVMAVMVVTPLMELLVVPVAL